MPTVTIPCYADAGFIGSNTGSNYGTSTNFSLDGGTGKRWAAFHFNISSIPTGARINSAHLIIRRYSGGTPTVAATRYTATWAETSVTPNNEPARSADGDGSVTFGSTVADYNVPATNIVKKWIEDGASNYGIRLYASAGSLTYCRSRESIEPNLRPRLYVDYTDVPNMQVNIGDVWKPASQVLVNVADVWRTVTEAWVNVGDVWRKL